MGFLDKIAQELGSNKKLALKRLEDLRKQVRNTPEYKLLTEKKYRTPKGYEDYSAVAEKVGIQSYNFRLRPDMLDENIDFAGTMAAVLSTHLSRLKCPVYWIAAELLEAISKTDLPPHVVEMQRPVKEGIFMIPKGALITPDGEHVDHICFQHCLVGDPVISLASGSLIFYLGPTQYNKLNTFTTVASGIAYASTTGLKQQSDGGLLWGEWNPSENIGRFGHKANPQEIEQSFLRQMDSIVIQILLYMQTRPNAVEMGAMVGFGGGKSAMQSKKQAAVLLNPTWIGKDYRSPRTRTTPTRTHASPAMHWRRGHWRQQPVGEGRTERKWVWIQPLLVNG